MKDVLPEGIAARTVETSRLATHVLEGGSPDGEPALVVHGNVSSSLFFDGTLAALPEGFRGIAPDLRGFGYSETGPVDATRGLRDFSEDLRALVDALGLGRVHVRPGPAHLAEPPQPEQEAGDHERPAE